MKCINVLNSRKGGNVPSIKAMQNHAERLFDKADKIQDKYKHGEAAERELHKMNLLYTEASAIAITLEATGNA
jgi:hypothetical protein